MVAGLALIAMLALSVSAASAADPTVTIGPIPTTEYTTAQVTGTVNPEGEGTYYEFESSTDQINWSGFNYGGYLTDPGSNSVSREFTELKPGTQYFFRLVALHADGSPFVISGEVSATTKAVPAPAVTFDPITTFTSSTAHFSGTVSANAPAGPYSPAQEAAYETKWHFECTPECQNAPSGVVLAGEAPKTVSADIVRLEANTVYEVKLVASNAGLPVSPERIFQTSLILPLVKSAAGGSDGKGGYNLEGVVNPFNSKITDCHFEYGPTANYVFEAPCSPMPAGRDEVQKITIEGVEGKFTLTFRGETTNEMPAGASPELVETELKALAAVGPTGITEVSREEGFFAWLYVVKFGGSLAETNVGIVSVKDGTPPISGGSGHGSRTETIVDGGNNLPIVVEAHVTGLTPDATYHFQVVATNGAGKVESGDRIFVPTLAPPQPPCPNDPAREENSSLLLPDCRAYEQVTAPNKTGYPGIMYSYFNGSAVAYQSGAGNINNSGQGFPGQGNRYVANRTADGWKTIANLNGEGGSIFSGPQALFGPRSPDAYSEDLQTSFWFTKPGAVSNSERDAYLREPDGSFTLIGHAIHGGGANTWYQESGVVGSSSDLSHLVLNGGIPPNQMILGPGVYEFVGTGNDLPRRVDLDNAGNPISDCPYTPAGSAATGNAVSKDGSAISFTLLSCAGGPAANEVWVRVDGTTSYDASESHCTRTAGEPGGVCNAPAPAQFVKAATDGSSVFFTTTQQLVNGDTDNTSDLYVYDLPTASNPNPSPALTEVSGAAGKADVQQAAVVSNDGSTAYFVASGVLADNEDAFEETAVAGDHNLYVWRRDAEHPAGETKFVGRLFSLDLAVPEATPDGRYLVLTTASPLVPTDSDNALDVYRYDPDTETMLRISTNTSGVGGNGDGLNAEITNPTYLFEVTRRSLSPAVSDNGETIVFTTSEALSPLDGNDAPDVYAWKAGKVSLITTGSVGGGGDTAIVDGSGQDIYFTSRQALSPSDTDQAKDVYDAREGGGFRFAEAAKCSGEACQPTGPGSPPSPNPATDRPPAAEGKPKQPCPKGKVAKHGHCVKKHHKKPHKKGKRAAKGHRGGAK